MQRWAVLDPTLVNAGSSFVISFEEKVCAGVSRDYHLDPLDLLMDLQWSSAKIEVLFLCRDGQYWTKR